MRMTSCAKRYTVAPSPKAEQNRSAEMVQAAAIEEYRRALLLPFWNAPYGSKAKHPQLISLMKHVGHGENKVAETTMRLAFGAVALGAVKEKACHPFVIAQSIIASQYPDNTPSEFPDLSEWETAIQGEFDVVQHRMLRGDYSHKTLQDAHERLTRMREVIDRMLAWIERKLYRGIPS